MKYNPKQVKFTQKRLILPVLGATLHLFQGGDIYYTEVISKQIIFFLGGGACFWHRATPPARRRAEQRGPGFPWQADLPILHAKGLTPKPGRSSQVAPHELTSCAAGGAILKEHPLFLGTK
jgi:hypothetical protein